MKKLQDSVIGFSLLLAIYLFIIKDSLKIAVIGFFIPLVIMMIIVIAVNIIKEKKYKKSRIKDIDKMTGKEFEEYLAVLFKYHGYKVNRTRYSRDFGADLIIKKSGITTVIQAKRYSSKVGIKAIQEIVSAKAYYNATESMVITNSFYTKPAIELAKKNKVKLINRNELIDMLVKLNPNGHITEITEKESLSSSK